MHPFHKQQFQHDSSNLKKQTVSGNSTIYFLLNHKKIGGIVIDRLEGRVLIGIGLNLMAAPVGLPQAYSAGSIHNEVDVDIEFTEVLDFLTSYFHHFYDEMKKIDGGVLHKEYTSKLAGLGQPIRVQTRDGEYTGILEGIHETGALLLKDDDVVRKIYAADVFLT